MPKIALNDKKKKLILVVIGVLIAGIAFKGVFVKKKPVQVQEVKHPVTVAKAVEKQIPIYIDSFGTVYSTSDVDIKSQVFGEIIEVNFISGKLVNKGDLLFVIDPSAYKAEVDKTKALLEQDETVLKFKKDTVERNQKLFDDGLISSQDFESLQTDSSSMESKLKLDQADVDASNINFEHCYIHSPVTGIAGNNQLEKGNIVSEGSGQVLVNIQTIDTVLVYFTVPEKKLTEIQKAMAKNKLEVNFFSEGEDNKMHKGTVTFIDNKIDQTTGTVMLHAELPNEDKELWAGQFGKVRLILKVEDNAIVVPSDAVKIGQQGSYLYVVDENDTAQLRSVKTSEEYNDDTIILSGVSSGEKIVVTGQMGLSQGAKVIEEGQEVAVETK